VVLYGRGPSPAFSFIMGSLNARACRVFQKGTQAAKRMRARGICLSAVGGFRRGNRKTAVRIFGGVNDDTG
jgi:hypothetical protein